MKFYKDQLKPLATTNYILCSHEEFTTNSGARFFIDTYKFNEKGAKYFRFGEIWKGSEILYNNDILSSKPNKKRIIKNY